MVATGPFHTPYTPPCNTKIADSITQMHSNYYKGLDQLQEGDALVVGGGDSGYQILNELSKDGRRKVFFSGRYHGKILAAAYFRQVIVVVVYCHRFSKF